MKYLGFKEYIAFAQYTCTLLALSNVTACTCTNISMTIDINAVKGIRKMVLPNDIVRNNNKYFILTIA